MPDDINLLPILLLLPLTYLLYTVCFPSPTPQLSKPATSHHESYNFLPSTHPPVSLFRSYTPAELLPFNGTANPRILLAIQRIDKVRRIVKATKEGERDMVYFDEARKERTVFDVTAGKGFYGPDGPYGNFAGRDASRGMAKQSFDDDMITPLDKPLDKLDDLSKSELDNMSGWHSHFTNKYIVCGELVEDPKFS